MIGSKIHDSGAKLLFSNAQLCAQFLRNYSGFELFKNIEAEDIEDVSERFVHMFSEDRESDVIKHVHLHPDNPVIKDMDDNRDVFVIALIDHKSGVDYNVSMQLLRYMVYIWERYEKDAKSQYKRMLKERDKHSENEGSGDLADNSSKSFVKSPAHKEFKYPLILPIIFYEDDRNWTADPCLKDRIAFGDLFGRYIPDFEYRLVRIYDNSPEDILKHNDEFSMMMALMQIMGLKDIEVLNDKKKQMSDVYKNSSHEIRSIVSQLIEYIMRKMEFSEEEVQDVISCVEEKKVERLFEYSHVANNMRILREKSAKYDEMSAKYEDMSERYNSVILDFNDAEERLRKAENAVQVERKLREEKEELAVCNMLADGISHDKISEYTGMPVEKIRQLADKL